ncbi:MAG: DNA repair protein RecO, partial [Dehalococcoidia bacterium]|nr:DNA repair protein RecO [Dehalococcoidia bacterium]
DIITQAQTIETFQPLRDDLAPLSRALYAAELLDRATEEREENFALYRLLLDTLRRLSQGGDLDLALRFFEMALLGQLGYRPEIERCVVCQRPLEAGQQAWAPGAGGAVCSSCRPTDVTLRPLSVNALRVLRLLQRGEFRDVASLQVTAELAGELERHLREAIHFALERDIRSAAFLDAVRRPVRGPASSGSPGPRQPTAL